MTEEQIRETLEELYKESQELKEQLFHCEGNIDCFEERLIRIRKSHMRFKDIKLEDLDTNLGNGEWDGNYSIPATDELVEITNTIRSRWGNTDLVGASYVNDVYYNFYLYFNGTTKELKLQAVCNYGEKDDEVWYDIELIPEEKEMLMWKVIRQLLIDLE